MEVTMKNFACALLIMVTVCLLAAGCQPTAAEPKTPSATPAAEEQVGDSTSKNESVDEATNVSATDSPTESSADFQPSKGGLTSPSFTQTISATLVEFQMLLVPGDEAKGIQPFYLGKQEVSWDEFGYWALCEDMSLKKAIEAREKLLRPSPPHDTEGIYRGWGRKDQPAVGMSRLAAELYCKWLSEQTGRKYRLPTAAEWEHAFVSGGGELNAPPAAEQLEESAWFAGNSLNESGLDNRAMPLATKAPNSLGLHDMLGNVAEWVTDTGEDLIVRGGSFLSNANELSGAAAETENQMKWNKDYPREPKSVWWYVNADYVGFRLVCEGE